MSEASVVRDGQRLVRRRVPDVGVDAVEDAEVAVALRPQRAVEAHPELGRQRLTRVPGRHGVGEVRAIDRRQQEVDAVRVVAAERVARPQPQLVELLVARPAVVGEVVERDHRGHPGEERVARGLAAGPLEECRAGVPVVDVEHVQRHAVALQGGERHAAEHREPPRVVGEVVVRVAVERGGHVDQPQPVAVRGDVDDPGLERRPATRVGNGDRGLALGLGRHGHRPIAGQEHVHRRRELRPGLGQPAERPRERVDDVRQATGLRPRLALGGEERDSNRHRAMLPAGGPSTSPRSARRERRA